MTIDRSSYDKCDKGCDDSVLIQLMDWIGFLMHVLGNKVLAHMFIHCNT